MYKVYSILYMLAKLKFQNDKPYLGCFKIGSIDLQDVPIPNIPNANSIWKCGVLVQGLSWLGLTNGDWTMLGVIKMVTMNSRDNGDSCMIWQGMTRTIMG